jgi:RNA polymerase sigma-70 factor (ECF subfamily)
MSGTSRFARLQVVNTEVAAGGAQLVAREAARKQFETLYEEQRAAIARFLVAMIGNEDAALDLAAQTFERAWWACERGESIGPGWLFRAARNAAVDAKRRQRVREGLSRWHGASSTEPSAEDVVIGRHADDELRAMVRSLPSPQREAVVLRFTTRLAVREIGSVIGKGEDATEKLISRALKKLREDLDERN